MHYTQFMLLNDGNAQKNNGVGSANVAQVGDTLTFWRGNSQTSCYLLYSPFLCVCRNP